MRRARAAVLVPTLALLLACGGGGDAAPTVPPSPPPTGSAPVVLALSVRGGPPAGGTLVLAVGSGFEAGATVAVGGLSAGGVALVDLGPGSQAVRFLTPPHPEGFADVVVTNPGGRSATWPGFHYGPPPAVTGLACSAGCDSVRRDDVITVQGAAFSVGPGQGVTVTFSSPDRPQKAVAVQLSAAATEVAVIAPRLDPGLYAVAVSNFDGQYAVAGARLTYPAP